MIFPPHSRLLSIAHIGVTSSFARCTVTLSWYFCISQNNNIYQSFYLLCYLLLFHVLFCLITLILFILLYCPFQLNLILKLWLFCKFCTKLDCSFFFFAFTVLYNGIHVSCLVIRNLPLFSLCSTSSISPLLVLFSSFILSFSLHSSSFLPVPLFFFFHVHVLFLFFLLVIFLSKISVPQRFCSLLFLSHPFALYLL